MLNSPVYDVKGINFATQKNLDEPALPDHCAGPEIMDTFAAVLLIAICFLCSAESSQGQNKMRLTF